MQNVSNGKICIFMKTIAKYVHLDLFYVLDYLDLLICIYIEK